VITPTRPWPEGGTSSAPHWRPPGSRSWSTPSSTPRSATLSMAWRVASSCTTTPPWAHGLLDRGVDALDVDHDTRNSTPTLSSPSPPARSARYGRALSGNRLDAALAATRQPRVERAKLYTKIDRLNVIHDQRPDRARRQLHTQQRHLRRRQHRHDQWRHPQCLCWTARTATWAPSLPDRARQRHLRR
jgi:hypothetical protein